MVHQAGSVCGPSFVQGLLQRVEHEAGMRRPGDAPADEPAGVDIDDEGHIDEAGPGADIGEVREPQRVRCRSMEDPVHMIERARRCLVLHRCSDRLAPDRPFKTHLTHQPGDGAAGDVEALPPQLPPDLAHAIDPEVLLEDAPNLDPERVIPLRPDGQAGRVVPPGDMVVIGRRAIGSTLQIGSTPCTSR